MHLGYTREEQISKLQDNLNVYKQFNFIGILLSLSYVISLLNRMIFNIFSKYNL